ncbi:hypothetical protein DID78_01365 [Candidatus Marinamargulisbacteria bacterium SCGC AG-343-D04]|nr:hypothetical protein DID78_01365 [Candidatus Marinamargulisbacteria bacterium SCGC AG-343-D04]
MLRFLLICVYFYFFGPVFGESSIVLNNNRVYVNSFDSKFLGEVDFHKDSFDTVDGLDLSTLNFDQLDVTSLTIPVRPSKSALAHDIGSSDIPMTTQDFSKQPSKVGEEIVREEGREEDELLVLVEKVPNNLKEGDMEVISEEVNYGGLYTSADSYYLSSLPISSHRDAYFITGYDESPYGNQVKFQFSFKYNILNIKTFFGDDDLFLAYTQTTFWDIYSPMVSRRIYESNHYPEVFFRHYLHKDRITFVDAGFLHHSNGQDSHTSRGWNRMYLSYAWSVPVFFSNVPVKVAVTYFYPIKEGFEEENSDIEDYVGRVECRFNMLISKFSIFRNVRITGLLRSHSQDTFPTTMLGLDYTNLFFFPDLIAPNYYFQWWRGYGENLQFYNSFTNSVRFGLEFKFF